MKLVLEQSQKISKLESKIQASGIGNAGAHGPRELRARQLLPSTNPSEEDDLDFTDKSEVHGANIVVKETQGSGSSARDEIMRRLKEHPPPTSGPQKRRPSAQGPGYSDQKNG